MAPRWVVPPPAASVAAADRVVLGDASATAAHTRTLMPRRGPVAQGKKLLWRPLKLLRAHVLAKWAPLPSAVRGWAACEGDIDDASDMRGLWKGQTVHTCGELRYCVQRERICRSLYSVPHGQCLADVFAVWLASLPR